MNREATDLAGVRHIVYDTLGSTNAEALALARAGERGPLWISARSQDAGRGRRGNAWASPPGNLYATLLLTEPSPKPQAPQLSFVAALALHDAVCECAPQFGPALQVKWPNDLLLGPAKLAGILIEGESEPAFAVAIGIGVKLREPPRRYAVPGNRSRCRRRLGDAGRAAGRARRHHGAASRAVAARGGLRRHPRRLAQVGPQASASRSACGCRSGNSAAASTASMRWDGCSSSSPAD